MWASIKNKPFIIHYLIHFTALDPVQNTPQWKSACYWSFAPTMQRVDRRAKEVFRCLSRRFNLTWKECDVEMDVQVIDLKEQTQCSSWPPKRKCRNFDFNNSIYIIKNDQSSKWLDLELSVLSNRFKLEDYQNSILDFIYILN